MFFAHYVHSTQKENQNDSRPKDISSRYIVYLLLILHRGKIGCCKEFHDYSTQGQDIKGQM